MATLTTANSALSLAVANLFPAPVPIQGYAADDAFMVGDVESAETYMGVDGILSAGFTPYPVDLDITLQADSASNAFFDAWIAAEFQAREKYIASGTTLIKGTGALYQFTRGFLKSPSLMPEAKKVLQPRKFKIVFNSVSLAPA
jgi:hypothetical protein